MTQPQAEFESSSYKLFTPRIFAALKSLLEAHLYAIDTSSDLWDFAISLSEIQRFGLSLSDLRWLIRKDLIRHAKETTIKGTEGRRFEDSSELVFVKRTCFTLTKIGVDLVERFDAEFIRSKTVRIPNGVRLHEANPHWNAETRELHFDGKLVKRFRWPAENQEIILATFEEMGWPRVIDDPLPPKVEQDRKSKLQDTIKALNRKQESQSIRFHGNGTGDGVRWDALHDKA